MNIPDDAFFALLTRGIQQRGDATLQRALYQALREAILQGELLSHSRLPGARVIAQRAGVSRNTVNSALEQLAIEGYLIRSRQGTYVAALNTLAESEPAPPTFVLPERLRTLPLPGRRDSPALLLTTGMPAVNYFPLVIWRRLLDRVLREDGSTILGYGEAAGEPALREAIARHLTLSRGIRCTARQIVITEGALEGVNLCTHLLSVAGDTAWVEEPGYFGAKSVFIKAGLQLKGIPVDGDGMCPDSVNEVAPRLIFTSPSHQYPSGAVMSA
ncbi:PLP-dependent aminotransferase family protein, partial [Escherichia coli]|nr:PLP-dependent aminotransferase family protein [Escherichia coli]